MKLTDSDIRERFIYHTPSEEGIESHARLSGVMITAATVVEATCIDSREKSLALTKLEEAKFWASAAVARNPKTR